MTKPFEGNLSLDEQKIEKARTVIKGVYIHKTDWLFDDIGHNSDSNSEIEENQG